MAVSKTKPAEIVREAYDAGLRDFGENYVQELIDKAPALPSDAQWRFIGHLQSNKAKALVQAVPNLAAVETVDSEKLASKLDAAVGGAGRPPLPVLIQVNTSGEETKYGVEPQECLPLARHIVDNCPNLVFRGLMTIGMKGGCGLGDWEGWGGGWVLRRVALVTVTLSIHSILLSYTLCLDPSLPPPISPTPPPVPSLQITPRAPRTSSA